MKIMKALLMLLSSVAMADTPPPIVVSRMVPVSINVFSSPYMVPSQANFTINCDASSGPVAVYLPLMTSQNQGSSVNLTKVDSSVNTCTFYTSGSNTLSGVTVFPVLNRWDSLSAQSSGQTNLWKVQ